MRYLVVTTLRFSLPPEMAMGLFDALSKWAKRYKEAGKFEQIWSFAGLQGGGGILNVDSLDELDQIMIEFPLGPFSKVEMHGLVDLDESLDRTKKAMAR